MNRDDPDDWLRAAVAEVERKSLLAYPTETTWGLGADVAQAGALQRLRRLKDLRGEKPFSVLVGSYDALAALGFDASATGARMAERFWPGPLTLVLRCQASWARNVGRPDGAVAVRCSSHPTARRLAETLARRSLGPLTATSLNRSGEEPVRTRRDAERFCNDSACFLAAPPGGEAGGDEASTIVDLTTPVPALLRCGALAREGLSEWIPNT